MGYVAFVTFLLAHAFVHVAVWAMPRPATDRPPPFDPAHSWALAAGGVRPTAQRATSVVLAWTAALLFAASAIALVVGASSWTSVALAAGAVGIVLKVLWFNRWLSLAVALDAGVLAAAAASWPTA